MCVCEWDGRGGRDEMIWRKTERRLLVSRKTVKAEGGGDGKCGGGGGRDEECSSEVHSRHLHRAGINKMGTMLLAYGGVLAPGVGHAHSARGG